MKPIWSLLHILINQIFGLQRMRSIKYSFGKHSIPCHIFACIDGRKLELPLEEVTLEIGMISSPNEHSRWLNHIEMELSKRDLSMMVFMVTQDKFISLHIPL